MNDRIKRLRRQTFEAQPSLSIERALIETRFYRENYGKYPIPILRALNFLEICKRKTIYIVEDDSSIRELEQYALQSNGYDARGCEDAASFRAAVREPRPEQVILDVVQTGFDLLHALAGHTKGQVFAFGQAVVALGLLLPEQLGIFGAHIV